MVRLLEEDRIDLGKIYELLDVDRAAALRRDREELRVRHGHEISGRKLDASHDVLALDGPRLGGSVALLGLVLRVTRPRDRGVERGGIIARDVGLERRRLVRARRALVPHAFARAAVEQMEANVLWVGGRIELDRDMHQPERDAACPDRLTHSPLPRASASVSMACGDGNLPAAARKRFP